jgi:hypothetical protein
MDILKVKTNLDNYATFKINNPGGKNFTLCLSKELGGGPFHGSVFTIVSEYGSEERPFYIRVDELKKMAQHIIDMI